MGQELEEFDFAKGGDWELQICQPLLNDKVSDQKVRVTYPVLLVVHYNFLHGD